MGAPAPKTPVSAVATCPFDTIVTECSDVQSISQAEAMCTSPCVSNIVDHFEACSHSTDPRVQSMFSSNNWGPLVSICRESLDQTSTGTGNDIATQCANIELSMTRQLTEVCCSDALCAAAPTSCSRQCSSVLMPFYHDCASEIMTSNAALFARLTGLVSICSHEPAAPGGGH